MANSRRRLNELKDVHVVHRLPTLALKHFLKYPVKSKG